MISQERNIKRLFFIVLVLLLLAVGGVAYYRTFLLNQIVSAAMLNFSHEVKWNKHQISDLQSELSLLQQRLQQQGESFQRQAQQVQEWRGLSQAGPSSRSRDHSAILDAQYYVRLGQDQLTLMADAPQALRLLIQAQIELNRVTEPQASALKKAVAEDIAALRSRPAFQVTQVYLSLVALSQQVEKLPLLVVPAQKQEPLSPTMAPPTSFWEKGLNQFYKVLRQIVVVYRLPSANTPPFIMPDQRPYIYENLRSTLSDASWAALHHDSEIYQNNLQQAALWIRRYFSMNSPLTKTVLTELDTLQALPLQPAKEVFLVSPKAFEDYLKTEPNSASTPTATPA